MASPSMHGRSLRAPDDLRPSRSQREQAQQRVASSGRDQRWMAEMEMVMRTLGPILAGALLRHRAERLPPHREELA